MVRSEDGATTDYALNKYASLFLKYNYPETKDLCKQFLTLVSAILVFSVTFAEKIGGGSDSVARSLLLAAWCAMLFALICAGSGLTLITLAAGDAVYCKWRIDKRARPAYAFIVLAGATFVIALLLLIATAFSAPSATRNAKPTATGFTTCTCR